MIEHLSAVEFGRRLCLDPTSLTPFSGVCAVLVHGHIGSAIDGEHRLASLPCLVLSQEPDVYADAVVDDRNLALVEGQVREHPQALVTAALLLRGAEQRTLEQSLVMESTTYSLMQSGAEFARWREQRALSAKHESDGAKVIAERSGNELTITLNRPRKRNAYSKMMRDQLAEALHVAIIDDSVTGVTLKGSGRNFSSGGDLDEFGNFSTTTESHLSRLSSSVAQMLIQLRRRLGTNLRAEVHGSNFGAGVELPAFCGWVVAHKESTFSLPEIEMGLVPGAGGTASITKRIGRQRTALMVFTSMSIDSSTALQWGLIDEIAQ